MNALLSEFFYDVICRVIPGMIVIGIYWHGLVAAIFPSKESVITASICIFFSAWLIGTMIERIVYVPCAALILLASNCKAFKKIGIIIRIRNKLIPPTPTVVPQPSSDPLAGEQRRQSYKLTAEHIMFRSLMIISIVSYFLPPSFDTYCWLSSYAIICAVTFFLAWAYGFVRP